MVVTNSAWNSEAALSVRRTKGLCTGFCAMVKYGLEPGSPE
jgi:hypothetical protein